MSQVLSEKAEELLLAGEEGEIVYMQIAMMGGRMQRTVSAGARTFTDGTPRSAAEWDEALQELENGGYVTPFASSEHGRRYCLSNDGYRKIDEIKAKNNMES